jgi:hypothetical protein
LSCSTNHLAHYGGRYRYKLGHIKEPESDTSGHTAVHVIYDVVPEELNLLANEPHVIWTFLTSMHVTEELAKDGYDNGKVIGKCQFKQW